MNRPLRMLARGDLDGRVDTHPTPYGVDLAKRYTGLHHAKRAGVHAQKEASLGALRIALKILAVGPKRIVQRIVDMGDRR